MKKSKIKNLLLLALLSLIASCNNDPISTEETSTVREKDYYLKLGKKLENPYSVKNMKRALDSVKAKMTISKTAKSTSDFDIETSHLYVKIEPKTKEEETLLKKDTAQILFEYPLDYEFPDEISESIGVKDTASVGTYYVSVPKDHVFPDNIKTEVLEELYIPEQDPYFDNATETGKVSKNTISNKEDLLGNLLIEAFKLTHNEAQLELQSTGTGKSSWWIFGKRWRPNGRITTQDNVLGPVPVEGAKVLIRQWFTVDSGITDANGNFSTGTVRGEARYIIQWERYEYSIRSGWFGQAETKSGYMKNQGWYPNIDGGVDEFYATIHRAAFHYYYKDIKGLSRPPGNAFWKPQMKIGAFDEVNTSINGSHSKDERFLGIFSRIDIYNPQNRTDEIYATVIHELAHAAHWDLSHNSFPDTDSKVKESWARGVQWELTRMVYLNYNSDFENRPKYTLVVRDMIDNDGFYGKTGTFGENVSGYTIKQIENSLRFAKSWDEWKNKIKNDYENSTENNLDVLFNYWN